MHIVRVNYGEKDVGKNRGTFLKGHIFEGAHF